MLAKREHALLRLQRAQQLHDEVAHRDILSFDLYKKLKHMVLHFYKYAGKIEQARAAADKEQLRKTLIDTFIICMATANALNVSLANKVDSSSDSFNDLANALGQTYASKDLFTEALHVLLVTGGKMAKIMESSDHMEQGDPRLHMETLIPELSLKVLAILGALGGELEQVILDRLAAVERKSIFRSLNTD